MPWACGMATDMCMAWYHALHSACSKRAVTQYRMGVRDVTELKEHIDGVIQAILSSRKVRFCGQKYSLQYAVALLFRDWEGLLMLFPPSGAPSDVYAQDGHMQHTPIPSTYEVSDKAQSTHSTRSLLLSSFSAFT